MAMTRDLTRDYQDPPIISRSIIGPHQSHTTLTQLSSSQALTQLWPQILKSNVIQGKTKKHS